MTGFTAKDADLPERCFEPLQVGILKVRAIDRRQFYETCNLIYDMLGWQQRFAAPESWKLSELGLDWVPGMPET